MSSIVPFPDFVETRPAWFWTATHAAVVWSQKRRPVRGMSTYRIPPTAPRWMRLDDHDIRQLERIGFTVRCRPSRTSAAG